jgi:hypothetical protein
MRIHTPHPALSIENKRVSLFVMFGMMPAVLKGIQSLRLHPGGFWLLSQTPTSQPRKHMKTKRVPQSNRLGAYLTATVGTSLLAAVPSDAAIVTLDIGPSGLIIGGLNAGLVAGESKPRENFPVPGGGTLVIDDHFGAYTGIGSVAGLTFASTGGYATPKNFPLGVSIDGGSTFTGPPGATWFLYDDASRVASPDFGPDSFMGFKTALGHYGWLEVRWDDTTEDFEILSGAYEDQVGVAINAGDTGVSAVPEPASALSTMGMLASGLLIRRRKRAT